MILEFTSNLKMAKKEKKCAEREQNCKIIREREGERERGREGECLL
jgi:hypothetical protein